MVKKIGLWVIGFVIAIAFYFMLHGALGRAERSECEQWIAESHSYVNYYLVDWQVQQCEFWGFDVSNIPVSGSR
jgi:hypothetical protein